MNTAFRIQIKPFSGLSADELYTLLKLRTDIFVVEQNCAYAELDDYDQECLHVLAYEGETLVAYARVVPPGAVYKQASIGRVAVHKAYRAKGYGRLLFKAALTETKKVHPNQVVKIQAQTYLEAFYQSFGFKTISEPYPDFGIWHVDMVLEKELKA